MPPVACVSWPPTVPTRTSYAAHSPGGVPPYGPARTMSKAAAARSGGTRRFFRPDRWGPRRSNTRCTWRHRELPRAAASRWDGIPLGGRASRGTRPHCRRRPRSPLRPVVRRVLIAPGSGPTPESSRVDGGPRLRHTRESRSPRHERTSDSIGLASQRSRRMGFGVTSFSVHIFG